MIRKINRIKNVGNFLNFSSESTPNFKRNTVIYANNGGGKTNLSKLLHRLSDPDANLDDMKSREAIESNQDIDFEIIIGNKTINAGNYREHGEQQLTSRIQVFGRDFVSDNVDCKDFSQKELGGEIVADIGKENIELQEAKLQLKNTRGKISAIYNQISGAFPGFCLEVESNRGYSRRINLNVWKELKLEKIIDGSNAPKEEEIGTLTNLGKSDEFRSCESKLAQIKSLGDTDKLSYKPSLEPDFDFGEIEELLTQEHTVTDVDNAAQADFNRIEAWLKGDNLSQQAIQQIVTKAITDSKKIDRCILCYRKLDGPSLKVLEQYSTYMRGERAAFEKRVDNISSRLNILKDGLENLDNKLQIAVNKYTDLFDIGDKWGVIGTSEALEELGVIIANLESKRTNPKSTYNYKTSLNELISTTKETVSSNQKLCDRINKKIDENAARVAELRTQVGKKLLGEFVSENNGSIESLRSANEEMRSQADEVERLETLAPQTSVVEQIQQIFNYFLNDVVGIEKYKAETKNGRLYIKLNHFDISQETHRISEGEKYMIGICYFFASCIRKLNSSNLFGQGIFVVDDPVSSTGYANFFGIISLIQKFEFRIGKVFGIEGATPKPQKIILTHNIQFFNVLQKHVRVEADKDSWEFFRLRDGGLKHLEAGRMLSDFEISLCRVIEAKQKSIDGVFPHNVGNDMRKVVETLNHFFGYDELNEKTLKNIFPYLNGREGLSSLYKMIQCLSHATTEYSSDPLDESLEAGIDQFLEIISHKESPFIMMYSKAKEMVETMSDTST